MSSEKYQQGCQTQVTQEKVIFWSGKPRNMFRKGFGKSWTLSMSLKVKDFFIVSGKSGNPQLVQCAELVGLHW